MNVSEVLNDVYKWSSKLNKRGAVIEIYENPMRGWVAFWLRSMCVTVSMDSYSINVTAGKHCEYFYNVDDMEKFFSKTLRIDIPEKKGE